jgi:hypothetical protein
LLVDLENKEQTDTKMRKYKGCKEEAREEREREKKAEHEYTNDSKTKRRRSMNREAKMKMNVSGNDIDVMITPELIEVVKLLSSEN